MTDKPNIEKILNVGPVPKEEFKLPEIIDNSNLPETMEDDIKFEEDFNKSRDNLNNVIMQANIALAKMQIIADDREDAKSFEAVNSLLKTLAQTAKDTLEIHEMRKKFKDLKANQKTLENKGIAVNNAVFVGTPNDLLKMVKNKDN